MHPIITQGNRLYKILANPAIRDYKMLLDTFDGLKNVLSNCTLLIEDTAVVMYQYQDSYIGHCKKIPLIMRVGRRFDTDLAERKRGERGRAGEGERESYRLGPYLGL